MPVFGLHVEQNSSHSNDVTPEQNATMRLRIWDGDFHFGS